MSMATEQEELEFTNITRRIARNLIVTGELYDTDVVGVRELLIESFDFEVEEHAKPAA